MGIWNDISDALSKGVEGAGRFADATSLKFKLGEAERKKRDLACDLGEKFYASVSSNEAISDDCEGIIAAMKACDAEIAQIKADIEDIARKAEASKAASVTYSCPSCGATLSAGSRFCHACGTALAPVQASPQSPLTPDSAEPAAQESQAAPQSQDFGACTAPQSASQSYEVPETSQQGFSSQR